MAAHPNNTPPAHIRAAAKAAYENSSFPIESRTLRTGKHYELIRHEDTHELIKTHFQTQSITLLYASNAEAILFFETMENSQQGNEYTKNF